MCICKYTYTPLYAPLQTQPWITHAMHIITHNLTHIRKFTSFCQDRTNIMGKKRRERCENSENHMTVSKTPSLPPPEANRWPWVGVHVTIAPVLHTEVNSSAFPFSGMGGWNSSEYTCSPVALKLFRAHLFILSTLPLWILVQPSPYQSSWKSCIAPLRVTIILLHT